MGKSNLFPKILYAKGNLLYVGFLSSCRTPTSIGRSPSSGLQVE